jgi:pimeloyl-ACP methyl ester carboxylesterase
MPTIIDNGKAPTVVLVHGAFADGSSWNGVIERLQAEGVAVIAPANPLRGVSIGTSITSPPSKGVSDTPSTAASSQSSSGGWPPRGGISTTRPSIAAPPPSRIPTTSRS